MRRVFKFDSLVCGLATRAPNVVPGATTRTPFKPTPATSTPSAKPPTPPPPTPSSSATSSSASTASPISALLRQRHERNAQPPRPPLIQKPSAPTGGGGGGGGGAPVGPRQSSHSRFMRGHKAAQERDVTAVKGGKHVPHGIFKPIEAPSEPTTMENIAKVKDSKKQLRQRAAIAAKYGANEEDEDDLIDKSVPSKDKRAAAAAAAASSFGGFDPTAKLGGAAAAEVAGKGPARGGFAARIRRQQEEEAAAAAAAAAASKNKGATAASAGDTVVDNDVDGDNDDDVDDDADDDFDGDVADDLPDGARPQSGSALAAAAQAASSAASRGGAEGAPRSRTEMTENYLKRQQNQAQYKKKQSQQRRALKQSSQPKVMTMPSQPTAKSLANAMQCRTVDVLKTMIKMGESPLSSEEPLIVELAEMIASDRGFQVLAAQPIPSSQLLEARPKPAPEVYAALPRRPPVVCIVGHIDHGKTTLLDRLRNSRVAAGEAGGITQAIGSFSIALSSGEPVTFIDTPGHVAFQTMRERGVNVTDIALLVVAADAGIQEQTLQALATVRESANCRLIVVVTKCDLPEVKPERVALEFTKHNVNAESFGGDVPFVHVSAKTGAGLEELEQQLLVTADELDLRADVESGSAEAVVLEANNDPTQGAAAAVVVRRGELAVGDVFVCGTTVGRVRALVGDNAKAVKSARPGSAVLLSGFRELPSAGDEVFVVESERVARRYAEARTHARAQADMSKRHHDAALLAAERRRMRIEMLQNEAAQLNARAINSANIDELTVGILRYQTTLREKSLAAKRSAEENEYPKSLVLMLKAQSVGALEALTLAVQGLPEDDDVEVSIAQSSVGDVSDGDVESAVAIGAVMVLYGVPDPSARARAMLEQNQVTIISSPIIYRLLDSIKDEGAKLLRPVETVTMIGRALIQKLFVIDANSSRATTIAGCRVVSGTVKQGAHVRIVKQGEANIEANAFSLNGEVPTSKLKEARVGRVRTLRHLKEAVKEIKKDTECGIDVQGVGDFGEGDFIDCLAVEYKKRAWGTPAAPPPIFDK